MQDDIKKRIGSIGLGKLLNRHKIYEDEALLVLNKPRGISVLKERAGTSSSILELVRQVYPEIKVCHRLDKFTTGVLLLAKDIESYRAIALQFQKRQVRKIYWALSHGVHLFDGKTFRHGFLQGKKRAIITDRKEGKLALIRLRTLECFERFTLIEAQPLTGRTHQVRAQLSFLGAPIIGDKKYGGEDIYFSQFRAPRLHPMWLHLTPEQRGEQPLNIAYLLHAYSLTFVHPLSGEEVSFQVEPDKNFTGVLQVLRRHNPPPDTFQMYIRKLNS